MRRRASIGVAETAMDLAYSDVPIDDILMVIDVEMANQRQPKVILFDIGGVCVVSPFQAILDYELSLGIPPGWVNYSISRTAPNGFWHHLERGKIPMDAQFFAGFNRDLHDPVRWEAFYKSQQGKDLKLPGDIPPVPKLDGEWLFNEMMTKSDAPDPWMFPALQKLKASGKYILMALSNTVIFRQGHPLWKKDFYDNPVKAIFDVFISSAHVGMRKPEPEIYQLALREANQYSSTNADSERGRALGWADGIRPDDILFLDDIGENLKAGRRAGFRTLKVNLGRAFEAVDELEKITTLDLAGTHPKVPILPNLRGTKAKI